MNIDKILQTLQDSGFSDCEYVNGMIKVYYSSGPSIHEEVGKILKKCGYNKSFSTSGRYSGKREKIVEEEKSDPEDD